MLRLLRMLAMSRRRLSRFLKTARLSSIRARQNPRRAGHRAAAVGIDKKNVIVQTYAAGGGFGRKSKPDYVQGGGGVEKIASR